MAVASILLSALALLFTGLGVLLVPIPLVGALFAFGAPAAALLGVVLGGRAMSERRRTGQSGDAALLGVIFSAIAFVPALLCALTCGVCNALCATGTLEHQRGFGVGVGAPLPLQGDASVAPPPWPAHAPEPAAGVDAGAGPATGATTAPSDAPSEQGPARSLPPPPLPAGPKAPARGDP